MLEEIPHESYIVFQLMNYRKQLLQEETHRKSPYSLFLPIRIAALVYECW